jgi:hypothetical protein
VPVPPEVPWWTTVLEGVGGALLVIFTLGATIPSDSPVPKPLPPPQPQPQPVPSPQPAPREGEPSCSTTFPNLHECWQLEVDFDYEAAGVTQDQARDVMLSLLKRANPKAKLEAYNNAVTTKGPCIGEGLHTNVRDTNVPPPDNYFGSIVCCPCCADELTGPVLEARCGFIP